MRSFIADDGVEIVFDDHRPDAAGTPVVLHHGFAADAATNWQAPGIVDRLLAAGRRVIALDARGHGRSGKPHDPQAYDSPAMARDVSSLLDHLALGRVDLVGYSMGGFVALEVASRDRRLRSLVVGGIGATAIPSGSVVGPAIDKAAVAAALEAPDLTDVGDRGAAGFRALADATGADRRALAAIVRADPHRVDDLSTITIPTLVLAGSRDPLAAGADQLVAALHRARLETVPGSHLGAVGSAELVDALVTFLSAS